MTERELLREALLAIVTDDEDRLVDVGQRIDGYLKQCDTKWVSGMWGELRHKEQSKTPSFCKEGVLVDS